MKLHYLLSLFFIITCITFSTAQNRKKNNDQGSSSQKEPDLSALSFRSIGPAITSGRIADFAVNPNHRNEYYVAVASGGVWKTVNAGTTWEPLFDKEGSYSIGCITLDPNNPNTVWVGSGENNNQRSVAYGDGIYLSKDGGKTWKNMGLKNSEHIGKIIVHPENSDIVYVAAIGPVWSAGGDRGVYKTTNGGQTWEPVLQISENTGINDLEMDPRNPDVLYATAYQRRRHVFTWISGGPESAIYKSTDGGKTWNKSQQGLPDTVLGRMDIAISPADPDVMYVIAEAMLDKGGVFRSTNRGASWEKMSGYVTSGNYYQEIVCDPKDVDRLYAMDTWLHFSEDGGKTFKMLGESSKHVDNHAMWIDPADTDYYLVGCDGGIYESFDRAKTWHYISNLPVTQFYKVAVDNAEPFYNVYGGTQDNFSMGGPSRTISQSGITNADWFMTLGGDGFQSQVDPENPNIVYAQYQYGNLFRFDKQSGEKIGIKPREDKDEPEFRWNWDAPLIISPHNPTRLYFAANKLFKSDNRGNSWETISPDLTRQLDRNKIPVMGKIWSMDAIEKNGSTSPYGNIVALEESPLQEGLLYVGSDDGLVQVSENTGESWAQYGTFPGVPERTYVNDLMASQHDANTVYAAFNNHKNGDFKPYVLKSMDKGKTWTSITNNLPERGSVYTLAEDHVDPNLLFVGTEFGVFYTNNSGQSWIQLKQGLPTIAVRDIAIQRRENDLVLATFGRGFYILDNYTPLRTMEEILAQESHIFPVKDALIYAESAPLGLRGKSFQGDNYYLAQNPPFGATFTYYLKEEIKSSKDQREEAEKQAREKEESVYYPSYEQLRAEAEEEAPSLIFTIADAAGSTIKELTAEPKAGVKRITWDLRYPSPNPVSLSKPDFENPFASPDVGSMVESGNYSVSLAKKVKGEITQLAGPVTFAVIPLENRTLPAEDRNALVTFQQEAADLSRAVQGAIRMSNELTEKLKYMRAALSQTPKAPESVTENLQDIDKKITDLKIKLTGDPVAQRLDKGVPPSINSRISSIIDEQSSSTSAPTQTQKDALKIAGESFAPVLADLKNLAENVQSVEKQLEDAGAPYTPGRVIEWTGN